MIVKGIAGFEILGQVSIPRMAGATQPHDTSRGQWGDGRVM
jgi:hypothetical protein